MPRRLRLTPTGNRVTPDERYWQERADDWRRTALDRTRTAADGWVKALGAIVGLLGFLTIFKGPENLDGLSSGYRVAIGTLVLVALLAALGAIILGALAARGRLDGKMRSTAADYRRRYRDELDSAVKRLRWSFWLATLALIPLIVAVGFAWYAPRTSKQLLVTRSDGTSVCFPRNASGTTIAVEIEAVTAVRTVDRCPP